MAACIGGHNHTELEFHLQAVAESYALSRPQLRALPPPEVEPQQDNQ